MSALREAIRRLRGYQPERYWEGRAEGLVETYDHPETWAERGWLREGAEDEIVPRLLREHGCRTVLVPGCGSGRQYDHLRGFEVCGFDISPTLVRSCEERYPDIPTRLGDVLDCDRVFGPRDAVAVSATLAHVAPKNIERCVEAVKGAADKLLVVREYSAISGDFAYMFAHDYPGLVGWPVVHREVTDERPGFRAELIAFAR